ncbi:MAG: hypothetical protein ACYTG5_08080 [Planctomycetota bacterium]|jgi:hypothetical protein
MSSDSAQNHCAYSDAVLALLLDGDGDTQLIQENAWERNVSAADLAKHRRECPICSVTIDSARRLDGLLAASTELAIEEDLADQLLARAHFEAASVEESSVPGEVASRRGGLGMLAGLGLLLLGFLAGSLFWQSSEESDHPLDSATRLVSRTSDSGEGPLQPGGEDSTLEPGMIRVPDGPLARKRSSADRRDLSPAQLAYSLELTDRIGPLVASMLSFADRLQLTDLRWLSHRLDGALKDVQSQSLRSLLDSGTTESRHLILACISNWPEGETLQELLTETRRTGSIGRLLARRITREFEDDALLRAAGRLGGREIDQQLATIVEDRPEIGDRIARHLASLHHRPQRERLLLDLWEAVQRKDRRLDELERARRWFDPLPAGSSQALLEEFHRSRRADRRRHVLLAISACGDAVPSEDLRLIVNGSRHQESELAAFALGQFPVGSDDLFEDLEWSRRPHLLLAALACRQDARLARSLAKMELSEAEQQFLTAGDFTPEQFSIAASLFRQKRDLAGL